MANTSEDQEVSGARTWIKVSFVTQVTHNMKSSPETYFLLGNLNTQLFSRTQRALQQIAYDRSPILSTKRRTSQSLTTDQSSRYSMVVLSVDAVAPHSRRYSYGAPALWSPTEYFK